MTLWLQHLLLLQSHWGYRQSQMFKCIGCRLINFTEISKQEEDICGLYHEKVSQLQVAERGKLTSFVVTAYKLCSHSQ
jgi:hypothetical protein